MSTTIQYKKYNPIWEPIPSYLQDWRERVQGRKIVIEIGPGVGLHPIQYAMRHPDKFVIGIEKTTEKYHKFARRVENHPQIDNVFAIHANAIDWITKNISENEVDEYFLLYPNPYPKESQRNKRLMHMPFMEHIVASMKKGATLSIATNMEFFYSEAKDSITDLEIIEDKLVTGIGRTHFERKYLQEGQKCYQLLFALR